MAIAGAYRLYGRICDVFQRIRLARETAGVQRTDRVVGDSYRMRRGAGKSAGSFLGYGIVGGKISLLRNDRRARPAYPQISYKPFRRYADARRSADFRFERNEFLNGFYRTVHWRTGVRLSGLCRVCLFYAVRNRNTVVLHVLCDMQRACGTRTAAGGKRACLSEQRAADSVREDSFRYAADTSRSEKSDIVYADAV